MIMSKQSSWYKKIAVIGITVALFFALVLYVSRSSVHIIDFKYARDAKDIHALFNKDWYWLVAASPQEYDVDLVLRYRALLSEPGSIGALTIKVLYDQDDFKGFVAYHKKSAHVGFILFLSVKDDVRRKGYGERLARFAVDDLRAQGCTTIELVTRPSNERALSLYKKLGFKEIRRDTDFVYLAFIE